MGLQKDADGKLLDDWCTICRTCRGQIKAKYGNTSNLLSQLKMHHPRVYQEAMKSGKMPQSKSTTLLPVAQSTIQERVKHAQKYE